MDIHKAIRHRRLQLGLSQRALGEQCRLSPKVIERLENCRNPNPTYFTLVALQKGLRLRSIADLFHPTPVKIEEPLPLKAPVRRLLKVAAELEHWQVSILIKVGKGFERSNTTRKEKRLP